MITTLAGNGTAGFSGDNGPATSAQLNTPRGIAVDSAGNVYIADLNNNRIRVLTPAASGPTANSPAISAVTNAASNLGGPIAPGEIVVLYGSGLGPAQLTSASLGSDGLYDTDARGYPRSIRWNRRTNALHFCCLCGRHRALRSHRHQHPGYRDIPGADFRLGNSSIGWIRLLDCSRLVLPARGKLRRSIRMGRLTVRQRRSPSGELSRFSRLVKGKVRRREWMASLQLHHCPLRFFG